MAHSSAVSHIGNYRRASRVGRRLAFLAMSLFAQHLGAQTSATAPLTEMRQSFTLGGKPVPPEVFRDFGDGDLADAKGIIDSIDVRAAIGSNRYADSIDKHSAWLSQRSGDGQETGYRFIGSTQNGLLAAIAYYSGGGSGSFFTLHILDVARHEAIGPDGRTYLRIDLSTVESVPLGDRWNGDAKINGNVLEITTRGGALAKPSKTAHQIEARRP